MNLGREKKISNSIINGIRCDQCLNRKSHPSWIWISHKLKIIWLENPKVASTSIKVALGVQPKGSVPGDLSNPYGFKHLPLPRNRIFEFDNYFSFGFCRNPWDRIVSTWKNFTTGPSRMQLLTQHWKIARPDQLSFQQFVYLINKHWPIINHHWALQSEFLPVDKIKIGFIGRFESITESWNTTIKSRGIQRNLNHWYTTKHNHYSPYYDEETLRLVNKLYKKDIDLFDYIYRKEENNE
jgi:hypothetical protein